jgi:predicted nucleic acid-binding protein
VIYLDTSVALAQLLAEDRRPPEHLWTETLVSSRLLEYELWNRLHARKLATSHAEAARLLLARLAFLELSRPVLSRATQPFPVRVRTLDALHLASAVFLREAGQAVTIASYDRKLLAAAKALEFDTVRNLQ